MKQPKFLPEEDPVNQSRLVPSYIQSQIECELCAETYNLSDRTPMMICEQQHNSCLSCVKDIIAIKNVCPFCRSNLQIKNIRKNRMIAKIVDQVAKKKGITLQIIERPQEILNPKGPQRKQVIIPDVINDIDDHIYVPPERLYDPYEALLPPQREMIYNQSCISKFCRKLQFANGLYCFTYFLTLVYNVPFFICQLNYEASLEQQNCLDNSYGAGLTLRGWLMSSAIIGLVMYGITWFTILWKLCCFNRKTCPQKLMILNLVLFFLKFVGWNIYGMVVVSSVSDEDTATCDSSLQAYMQAVFIIQIVIMLGLCSLIKKRR